MCSNTDDENPSSGKYLIFMISFIRLPKWDRKFQIAMISSKLCPGKESCTDVKEHSNARQMEQPTTEIIKAEIVEQPSPQRQMEKSEYQRVMDILSQSRQKKPVSSAKLEANRHNAQRSTGPRTEQGKKWSRRNAIKHGILSSALLIDTREDKAAFEKLRGALNIHYQPLSVVEELLVEDIANCWWRLRRALHFETQAIIRSTETELWKLTGEGSVTQEEAMQLIREAVEEVQKRTGDGMEDIRSSVRRICSQSKEELSTRLERIRATRYLDICTEQDVRAKAKELGLEEAFEVAMAARRQQGDAAQWANPIPLDTRLNMPAEEDLNRILRYESSVYRKLLQDMNLLERLQRARKGEHVPAPLHLSLSTGD